MACRCLWEELTPKSATYGVSVDVGGKYGALGGVNALCPLVMYLWMPEFVDAFNVAICFLFLHVCVEEPGSSVVGELAEEVLGFIGCAWCFVFGVGESRWVVFVVVQAESLPG